MDNGKPVMRSPSEACGVDTMTIGVPLEPESSASSTGQRRTISETEKLAEDDVPDSSPDSKEERTGYRTTVDNNPRNEDATASGGNVFDIDLNETVRLALKAVKTANADDEQRPLYYENLGSAIRNQYARTQDDARLIAGYNELRQLAIFAAQNGDVLSNLLAAEQTGLISPPGGRTSTAQVNAAQENFVKLSQAYAKLALAPQTDKIAMWQIIAALDGGIRCTQAALSINAIDDGGDLAAAREDTRFNLSFLHLLRYERTNDLEDLNNAIFSGQATLRSLHVPERWQLITRLADNYLLWRKHTGASFPSRQLQDGMFDCRTTDVLTNQASRTFSLAWAMATSAIAIISADDDDEDDDDNGGEAVEELENAIMMGHRALSETNPDHEEHEAMINAIRVWQRSWSARTGKMPDGEPLVYMHSKGSFFLPEMELDPIPVHIGEFVYTGDITEKTI